MIGISDMVEYKVLVTRTTARKVGTGVEEALNGPEAPLALDFEGIYGFTPSFFDELLHSIGEIARRQGRELDMEIVNPPAELSSVHEAIARAHGLWIVENEKGSWRLGFPE